MTDPQTSETPRPYVTPLRIVSMQLATGDVSGSLVTPGGEVLWSHLSSSEAWLRHDLLKMGDRAAILAERYPDGYHVEVSR